MKSKAQLKRLKRRHEYNKYRLSVNAAEQRMTYVSPFDHLVALDAIGEKMADAFAEQFHRTSLSSRILVKTPLP